MFVCYHRIIHPTLSSEAELASRGKETQQYKRLFLNFPRLVSALSALVSAEELAGKLYFSAGLISESVWDEANVGGKTNAKKLCLLIKSVLSQVEMNVVNYDKFIIVLTEISGLQDIVELLKIV